jgi:hypothetical protein
MPTDFEPETPQPSSPRKWIALVAVAAAFVFAIALANRQVDRTTAMAPDKAPADKTVGLAPQGTPPGR